MMPPLQKANEMLLIYVCSRIFSATNIRECYCFLFGFFSNLTKSNGSVNYSDRNTKIFDWIVGKRGCLGER